VISAWASSIISLILSFTSARSSSKLTLEFSVCSLLSSFVISVKSVRVAIVKRIIENYGGKINVSSKLGEGTTFKISIPTNQVAIG